MNTSSIENSRVEKYGAEIASLANTASRLLFDALDGDPQGHLTDAAMMLCKQIGFIGDRLHIEAGGRSGCIGDADAWLLPEALQNIQAPEDGHR